MLEGKEASGRSGWMARVQQSEELRRHATPNVLFTGGGWTKDPTTKEPLYRRDFYLRLLRESGGADDTGRPNVR